MAQEQTAYAGDDIKVLVNVIGSSGTHVAAVINTTTTRLNGLSAAPTVTTVATGIYQIVFSGVTPAPSEGDRYTCKVNGTIAGVAWSEYGIPVKIVADERGTDNVVVPTSDITAIKAKTDQLAFTVSNQVDANALTGGGGGDATAANQTAISNAIASLNNFDPTSETVANVTTVSTVTNVVTTANAQDVSDILNSIPSNWDTMDIDASTGAVASQLTPDSIYLYFIGSNREDQFKADVAGLATASSISSLNDFNPATDPVANVTLVATTTTNSDMRGTDGANTVTPNTIAPDNASVTAIKAKTDQLAFTVSNQVDANALTGGGGDDAATIYNYFTGSSRQDTFKATGFATVNPDNASITAILADTNDLQTNQGDWLTATGFATVNPDNASITAIKAKTDQFTFTVSNQVDANALTGGGGDDAATIYNYFTGSNRQDTFRATGFNTVAPDNASIASILADTNELQTNQDDWLTATGFATVNPDNASIAAIKGKTDQFVFTVSNQVDANAITGGYPSGPGGSPTVVTVTSAGAPLENASVWVSTDAGGTNVIAGQLFTNINGQVTFMLDSGTYYCWVQHNEVNFPNPSTLTVS